MSRRSEITALIDREWVNKTLKRYGLSPTRRLFHMNNTTTVLAELLDRFPVPNASSQEARWDSECWNAWEAVGLYYLTEGRHYEALAIFTACYQQILEAQREGSFRMHKGKPLIWISDCYWHMHWFVHAKRYLMLAFCEDHLTDAGSIITNRGAFYRGMWRHGMSEGLFNALAQQAAESVYSSPETTMFPEALLQDISEDWLTEAPDPRESGIFTVNRLYARHLLDQTGEKSGRSLERLAHYLLSSMPGIRTRRRAVSGTSEYDIVCSVDGPEQDFRSELGRYFICECKDWSEKATYGAFTKFTNLLKKTNARFGILFSCKGITGEGQDRYAARERQQLYDKDQVVIVIITRTNIEQIIDGANLIEMLRRKYEEVRLDLQVRS
jgi:hypothetical protein